MLRRTYSDFETIREYEEAIEQEQRLRVPFVSRAHHFNPYDYYTCPVCEGQHYIKKRKKLCCCLPWRYAYVDCPECSQLN